MAEEVMAVFRKAFMPKQKKLKTFFGGFEMHKEWRIVKRFGKVFAQYRDETCAENEWGSALFPIKNAVNEVEKELYVWEESLGVYRRKFAID